MSVRLWSIETRRSVAIWLVPVLVAASWLLVDDNYELPGVLWIDTSVDVGRSLLFVGPFVGGAAVWMAGRDRRRGIEDLLDTTPRPAFVRDVALWAATAAWGVVAYALIAAYVAVLTARAATWGGPDGRTLLVGLTAIFAHAALGYAVGRYLPYRFTAPLVAIALFFVQVYFAWIVGYDRSSDLGPFHEAIAATTFLSPIADVDAFVWYGIWPDLALPRALWLLGVTAVALAMVALRGSRTVATWGGVAAALLLAVAGGTWTVVSAPALPEGARDGLFFAVQDPNFGLEPIPAKLTCSGDAFDVCVHPAFEPWLDEISTEINRVAAPLIGLPGVPTRAEQGPSNARLRYTADVIQFGLHASAGDQFAATHNTVECMVFDCAVRSRQTHDGNQAVEAIRNWLWRVSGDPFGNRLGPPGDPTVAAIDAATDRFAALPPPEQRAWLAANIIALRRGELTLEDLP